MKCPTPCYLCHELYELDHLHFNAACDCPDGCDHGICDECFFNFDGEENEVAIGERFARGWYAGN